MSPSFPRVLQAVYTCNFTFKSLIYLELVFTNSFTWCEEASDFIFYIYFIFHHCLLNVYFVYF